MQNDVCLENPTPLDLQDLAGKVVVNPKLLPPDVMGGLGGVPERIIKRRLACKKWASKNRARLRVYAHKRYWQKHEQVLKANRELHARKRSKYRDAHRAWCAAHREQRRRSNLKWRETHKDQINEHAKRYYQNNRKSRLEAVARYREAHPEAIRESRKRYEHSLSEEKKDQRRKRQRVRDCWRSAIERGDKNASRKCDSLIAQWKQKSKFRCYYCGHVFTISKLHVDHVRPLSKGGKHSCDNLCKSCSHCNLTKHAKLVQDFAPNGQKMLL